MNTLLYSLITGNYNFTQPDLNFHDHKLFPHHQAMTVTHIGFVNSGLHVGSFCSAKTQYTAYCNGYAKHWKQVRSNLDNLEQFYKLSNDAVWRTSLEINADYLNSICIDADLLFTDPDQFIVEIYKILDQYSIPYQANTTRALQYISMFIQTCWGKRTLGNTSSLAWLAWCHAIALNNHMTIPVHIATDFAGFVDQVQQKQDYFVNYTRENFLIV